MRKVFIGVGHGGTDPGAVANGFKEKDLNLDIALACMDVLIKNGVEVFISRNIDTSETLETRIKECNEFSPDLALDIHNNAGGGDGAEVYHHYGGGTSKRLATNIICEILNTGQNSRGVKSKVNNDGRDYYAFIRETISPAVIVECAFVDNTEDIKAVDSYDDRKNMGVAIARGILKTLGVSELPSEPLPETLYRVQVGAFTKKSNAKALQTQLKADGYEAIIV